MERKEKIKSDEIDLIGLLKKVWDGRKFLLTFCFIAILIGVVIAFSLPREYRSEAKIVPEDTRELKSHKANTLASLLGMNIDNVLNSEISADLYPVIVKSTPYLVDFANIKVQTQTHSEISLYEYVMLYQQEPWWNYILKLPQTIFGMFSDKQVWQNDTVWDSFRLTKPQRQFVNYLADQIKIKTDTETGLISIAVYMQDPTVAAVVAENVIRKLYAYIDIFRSQKAQEEIRFMEEMFVEARKTYDETQYRFNEFNKEYKNEGKSINSQIDLDLAFGLYNMMAQQYEMAKIRIMKKKPIFSVIEPAMIPLGAAAPSKALIVVISLALGFCCGVIWIFIRDAF